MNETGSHESTAANVPSDRGAGSAPRGRLTGIPLLIVALSVVLVVQAAFVLSYVGALHEPKPHHVAIGVAGASPLPIAVGKQFSLSIKRYSSEAAARTAIDERKIDGAFVVDSTGAKLIVAPAASPALASRSGRRLRSGRGCFRSEDRDRSGPHAAGRRCGRERLVPGRDGPDRRRLSRGDDRHGLRRTRGRGCAA